jgi:hypothetical protein
MAIRNYSNPAHVLNTLNGRPTYLGTITATTVKTNADTAVPFTLNPGTVLLIQADAEGYFSVGSAATLTASNGVLLQAKEKFLLILAGDDRTLQALPVSGTLNLSVHQLS